MRDEATTTPTDEHAVESVAALGRPLWSVFIPTHNCAQFLSRTLDGVLRELGERDDVEIVVVDDSSTDDPALVVAAHGRGRVRYDPNPEWLGAIATFNRCLRLARGELVHLLHGDDMVLPGFYAAMESALAESGAMAAICRARDVDADDNALYETKSYRTGTGLWPDALDVQSVSNRLRTPCLVVRRETYERIGGYRTEFPHVADWEMSVRIAANGPVVFVDRTLACYRRHAGSDTSVRLLSGTNTRERRTALAETMNHLPPERRGRLGRVGLLYTAYFGTRMAVTLVRRGQVTASVRHLREVALCLGALPRGIRPAASTITPPSVPPLPPASARGAGEVPRV